MRAPRTAPGRRRPAEVYPKSAWRRPALPKPAERRLPKQRPKLEFRRFGRAPAAHQEDGWGSLIPSRTRSVVDEAVGVRYDPQNARSQDSRKSLGCGEVPQFEVSETFQRGIFATCQRLARRHQFPLARRNSRLKHYRLRHLWSDQPTSSNERSQRCEMPGRIAFKPPSSHEHDCIHL